MRRLVALDLEGGPRFVELLRAVWDSGDAVLPVDQRLSGPQRRNIVAALGASSIHDGHELTELDTGIPVDDGDALVIATSGTTGSPKGVVLDHSAVRASALRTAAALGQVVSDHWLACLPLSHIGGLSVITRSLVTGAPVTVLPAFDADEVMRQSSKCTLVSLVPTALRRIDPSRFRRILLGGGRPPNDRPPNTVATYGMTETGSGVVYDGRPIADVELLILDHEILVRSPTNMRGYRDGTTCIDADGWLHTDDIGELDHTGRLHVRGRRGDVVNTGGEKVWPDSVEAVASELDPGGEHVMVGIPDPEWGEKVVLVTTSKTLTLGLIHDVVRERIAPFAAPKQLVYVESLPRSTNGKILRRQVRDRIMSDSTTLTASDS